FQDKWILTPKLTLTAGLRNDLWTTPYDAQNLYFNFDPKTQSVVVPDASAVSKVHPQWPTNIPVITAAQANFPEKLRTILYLNLSPRLALAWRPWDDKSVLRTGFGIYHDPLTFSSLLPFTGGPFGVAQTFRNEFDPTTGQFLVQFPRVTPPTI